MLGKNKTTGSSVESRTKVGTLIGEGAVFDGDLTAPETVRVDGTINGNCTCEKELIIGAEGQIKGNVSAQNVIISGQVTGDLTVHGKLELLSSGRIIGDIAARALVIDEDAHFDGRCTMITSDSHSSAGTAVNRLTDKSAEPDAGTAADSVTDKEE